MRETLELAQLCDRLGYHRYWLAEHHSSQALAGSTPEVLIARVASLTERMKIGSGGVMLPHYSSFKVAENFRMLETLFPGRIDVGIGRAPGSDQRTMRVLADGKPKWSDPAEYPLQVSDLVAWLHDALPDTHSARGVLAQPAGGTRARCLAARLERRECGARGAFRPAILLCAFHQSRRRRGRDARLPCPLPAVRPPSRAEGDDGDGRDVRRDRRGGRSPVEEPRAVGDASAHPERARPVPAGRGGACGREGCADTGLHGGDAPSRRHRLARRRCAPASRITRRATASRRSCW